jgi:hypothetical protein
MRLKSNRLGAIVLPTGYSLGLSGNNNFTVEVRLGAITSGGTWISAGTNSSVEYNLTATGITNGRIVDWKQVIGSNQFAGSAPEQALFAYQLERNTFTGVATEYTICLVTSGNNVNTYASVNWEEVT